jgi:hypothetical protein
MFPETNGFPDRGNLGKLETYDSLNTDQEIIDAAIAMLRELLPASWTINLQSAESYGQPVGATPIPGRPGRFDGTLTIQAPSSGYASLVVEARKSFTPKDANELVANINPVWRRQNQAGVLVIAPRLSRRTRDLLTQYGSHYIDLSGRIRIRVDSPPLFLDRDFAEDQPESTGATTQLRGPRAGRIVRLLLDVAPPYRVKDIAATTGVTAGYVSKALDALDDEALVRRGPRGEVVDCDWPALLRKWATSASSLTGRRSAQFIAQRGVRDFAQRSAERSNASAITGSYVAASIAPIAAPSLLVVYTTDLTATSKEAGLLPADQGSEVLLVEPADEVVFDRSWRNGPFRVAALTQVAADCLNGPGRMPAEGEALIEWMTQNEGLWRAANLEAVGKESSELNLPARPLFGGRS